MGQIEIRHTRNPAAVAVALPEEGCADSRRVRTGLPDDSSWRARIEQALDHHRADAASVGVIRVECANLKTIAERHGADVADRLVAELARRLRKQTEPGDLAAHLADAAFGLLVQSVEDATSAERLAGCLVHDLTRPLRLPTSEATPNVSVGVALSGLHGDTAAELLHASDAALREAQMLGGDTYLLAR